MYIKEKAREYQFFVLHALHQSLKQVDGFTLAEVEGFLDGCNDVVLHTVRKAAAWQLHVNLRLQSRDTNAHELSNT